MKIYIRSFLFIMTMLLVIVLAYYLSSVFRIADMFTMFLVRHLWIEIIILILLLISYIKSIRRKMKR